MSDSDGEEKVDSEKSILSDDDLEDVTETAGDTEYEPALYAMPPTKALLEAEGQVEVSNSPAFQCLEEMFQQGKLTGTEVSQLKARYMELYDHLKRSRENEFLLLQHAKKYTAEVESQQEKLEKAEEFPDNSNTEVSRLREQLLKYRNEEIQSSERVYELDYKIECMQEEKRLVEREYLRLPKADYEKLGLNSGDHDIVEELEKRMKLLHQNNDDLRVEMDQQRRECRKLRDSTKDLETQCSEIQANVEVTKDQVDNLKAELVAVNSLPSQYSKEAEKLRRQKIETEKEYHHQEEEFNRLREELMKMENRKMALEEEVEELKSIVSGHHLGLQKKQAEFDAVNKDLENAKEKELTLMTDRATLDVNLRHLSLEKRNLQETHSRRLRERDRELRNLKKSQLQLRVAEEGQLTTRQMFDKAKSNYDAFPKDDNSLFDRRKQLQLEVEQVKRSLETQTSLSAVEHVKVQQSVQEEERLLYELSDLRIEVVELTRLAAIKADEREQKARDFMRAEMRYHRAVEDLKAKQLQIQDHKKKFQEMQVKLKDFAKMYDIIKNERNKCVNLIQTTTQKAAEMREKIRILHNEIEILRSSLSQKEKQLQKQRLKHANAIVMRDSLRNEVSKQAHIEEEHREKREQLRLDIQRLNLMVNQAEEQMVQLRKQSDRAVQHRNDRAVQLIERNEEVYILQEKVKIQDTMIRKGEVELQAREEEIVFLNRHMQEENRSMGLLRKKLPNKRNLEDELTTLQIQLSTCRDRLTELEMECENPNTEGRLRYLEGKDLPPVEMQQKLEQLEVRLAAKEEQLLEKELLSEAVSRLVDQIQKRAMNGRDDTLRLAKDVNGFKSKMSSITKQMKASTAELTMYIAQAMRLEQEVKAKEALLQQYYRRMEKGEAPSGIMEEEWHRLEEAEMVRQRDREMSQLAAEEEAQYQLPHGGTTTAEPRPNAYIPDDDSELPIPRPYGSRAPFRPNEPGSTMRHIRKPKVKPIEI